MTIEDNSWLRAAAKSNNEKVNFRENQEEQKQEK